MEIDVSEAGYYNLFLTDINGRKINDVLNRTYLEQGVHKFELNTESQDFIIVHLVNEKGETNIKKIIKL